LSTAILHHMSPSCSLVSTQRSKPRRHISRCHISQSLRVETTALHDQNPRISDTRDATSHDRCGSKPSPGTIKTPRISDTRQAYLDAIVSRARTMGRRSHLPYGFAESGAANLCQWQASHHRCVFLPVRQTAGLPVRFLTLTATLSMPCSQTTCFSAAGAKNREQIYSAFENIYPVTQKFRKVAEPVDGGAAD
jgi:hypothetical protein